MSHIIELTDEQDEELAEEALAELAKLETADHADE